ncbi:MAG TPA: hypothetical protein VNJ01_05170 [Bacteriovoracaceae bacterium]|nr:hypothetical protein [Bacteriovoracaceae bacterium]
MKAVLDSKTVQALLSQEDGIGNLKGISYLNSGRATFGPASYTLTFTSRTMTGTQDCKMVATLNTQTIDVMGVDELECQN